jgi:hypothetical protein
MKDALEQLIDVNGPAHVLDLFIEVCHEKAEHLRTNWQDDDMARQWERIAKRLDKVTPAIGLIADTLGFKAVQS